MKSPRSSRAIPVLDSRSESQTHALASLLVDGVGPERLVFEGQRNHNVLRESPRVRSRLCDDVMKTTASGRSEYRLTVDANPTHVPQMVSWLIRCSPWTLPDTHRMRLRGALHELLINAVEHGNLEISYRDKQRALAEGCYKQLLAWRFVRAEGKRRWVTIHVLCDITAKRLAYCIIDKGKGFPWRDVFSQSRGCGYSEHGNGRGIILARSFFPSLSYNEQGNAVTIMVSLH